MPNQARSEIIRTWLIERFVINSSAGITNFFRSPHGAGLRYLNDSAKIPGNLTHHNDSYFWTTVGEAGYRMIAWHQLAGDDQPRDAIDIKNDLVNEAGHNNIILLHNGRRCTVDALEIALPILLAKHYRFVKTSLIDPIYDNGEYAH